MMIAVFFKLMAGHYLMDFGLQNDFIAKFKSPGSAPFWIHVMIAHCMMQAIPVYFVTGNVGLAELEFVAHFFIDYNKCRGRLSFNHDQALHVVCKLVWALCATAGTV